MNDYVGRDKFDSSMYEAPKYRNAYDLYCPHGCDKNPLPADKIYKLELENGTEKQHEIAVAREDNINARMIRDNIEHMSSRKYILDPAFMTLFILIIILIVINAALISYIVISSVVGTAIR